MLNTPKLGDYELDLGDRDLQKRIAHAYFRQSLDSYSSLSIHVATTAEEMEKWRSSQSPQEAHFTWNGKVIFKGHLLSVEASGFSGFNLKYVDNLFLATKESDNQFVKQQTLRDCLQKLVSDCQLSGQFQGNFSEMLSGFQQGSSSVFEVITSLSDKHGFHFVTRQGDQINFLKPGTGLSTANLDASKDAGNLLFRQSAAASYKKVQIRYFDPKSVEPKDTTLPSEQLYSSLASFTGSSSFGEKSKWKTAGGTLEAHLTDRHHFQNGHTLLSEQLSKKALEQESLSLVCFEPTFLPGDLMNVSGCPIPSLQNGKYLVAASEITVNSALPKLTLTAIRA